MIEEFIKFLGILSSNKASSTWGSQPPGGVDWTSTEGRLMATYNNHPLGAIPRVRYFSILDELTGAIAP